MSELILHVGMMKTATTFIQKNCAENRVKLRELGITYPSKAFNQQKEVYGICGSDVHWISNPTEQQVIAGKALLKEIEQCNERVLISSEALSTLSVDGIQRFVDTIGVPDKVVFTIRNLLSAIPSAWQQLIKGGSSLTLNEFINDLERTRPNRGGSWNTYSFGRSVANWSKFCPVELIFVDQGNGPFGAKANDVWELFQNFIGINGLPVKANASDSNLSLTPNLAEFFRLFNSYLKDRKGLKREDLGHLNNRIMKDFVFPTFSNRNLSKITLDENLFDKVLSWQKVELKEAIENSQRCYGTPLSYDSFEDYCSGMKSTNETDKDIINEVFNMFYENYKR